MSNQNVPALRLEGFSGEWENTTLGELGSTYGGLSGKKKEDFGHGDAMYVTYKDIFSRALITDTSQCERVEVDASQNEVGYGDIFFTTSSEIPEEVGLSAVWLIDKPNVYLNSFCFGFRPTGGFDLHFLGHVLRSPAVRSQFLLLAQGISRFNISKTKAASISLYAPPTLEEQQAIGAIFTNLDAAINQHTLKHKALQQAKTALMQRMFPQEGQTVPELRLEGFSGEWDVVKVEAIADSFSGGTPTVGTSAFYGGDIPFIRSSEISSSFTELTLTEAGLHFSSAKMVQPGWVLYALYGATAGEVNLAKIEGAINQAVLALIPRDGFNAAYLVAWLRMNKKNITNMYLQGGQGNLSGTLVKNLEVFIPPNLKEQQAIGAIFTNLDNLIAAEAQYIASLKQAKTALLQRMFI